MRLSHLAAKGGRATGGLAPARRAAVGILLLAACRQEPPPTGVHTEIATLSDGGIVVARGGQVQGIRFDGQLQWKVRLPEGDRITTSIAGAPNGTVYVRGRRTLYAVRAGQILWHRPTGAVPTDARARLFGPITSRESAVALMTAPGRFSRYGEGGEKQWDVRVPGAAQVAAPARFTPDELLVIPTTSGLYAVARNGKLDWHEPLESR